MGEGTGARNNARVLGALRGAAREENPGAYILGEHFFEATRWLQGDLEDGAMNYYGFAHPVRAFLAGQDVNYHPVAVDAAELDAWLTDARSRIPYANQLCQLNLLGSHDTARFLTLVGEDPGTDAPRPGAPIHLSRGALHLLRRRDRHDGRQRPLQPRLLRLGAQPLEPGLCAAGCRVSQPCARHIRPCAGAAIAP